MRTVVVLALAIVLFSGVPLALAAEAVPAAAVTDAGNQLCPVGGERVDQGVSYVYQGKKYLFCCAGCIPKFKDNPEKYLKNLK